MRIYTSSFFHYTKSLDSLQAILTEGFKVYYCLEEIYSQKDEVQKIGIPMVCFCDVPLNFFRQNHYGGERKYAIGMKRPWGIKNQLLPVHYYPNNKKCLSTKVIMDAAKIFLENRDEYDQYRILGYSKPIKKIEKEKGRSNNNFIEREWRKVYSSVHPCEWKTKEEYEVYRGDMNSIKKPITDKILSFGVDDIDCIIIDNGSVQQLANFILGDEFNHIGGKALLKLQDKNKLLVKIIPVSTLVNNI